MIQTREYTEQQLMLWFRGLPDDVRKSIVEYGRTHDLDFYKVLDAYKRIVDVPVDYENAFELLPEHLEYTVEDQIRDAYDVRESGVHECWTCRWWRNTPIVESGELVAIIQTAPCLWGMGDIKDVNVRYPDKKDVLVTYRCMSCEHWEAYREDDTTPLDDYENYSSQWWASYWEDMQRLGRSWDDPIWDFGGETAYGDHGL